MPSNTSIQAVDRPLWLEMETLHVTGDGSLKKLALVNLTRLDSLRLVDTAIETIALHLLRRVFDTLQIAGPSLLMMNQLSLPSLSTLCNLTLSDTAIETVDIPLLLALDRLEIAGTSVLTSLPLPGLTKINELMMTNTSIQL